ncbi:hypothetical protein H2200_012809 [Cladophialophora chaetospira]|uniref:6-methylsalicylate decarboxylase n=1 Tax=Cladophialophora chaetospira TaxID=386627 RepID=A0AA39CBY0_9EURO|nr:hypothetical protein H2200_012809 [Cladophialophora chaetospira]
MGRIDTHAHFVPPSWRQSCEQHGHGKPDGMPEIPAWDPEQHLSLMDKLDIEKSIVSITSPGTTLVAGDIAIAVDVTRASNDYAADLKRARPNRFGFWASLPLPFVQESVQEVQRALGELDADGVGLMTNYYGQYLGDASFDPVFGELNARSATVFIHPTGPCVMAASDDGVDNQPRRASPLKQNYPDPMFEYLFETARCAINLFLSGTVSRYPDITFVLSHAGGALPPIVQRFTTFSSAILKLDNGVTAATVRQMLQTRFFFDLAGFPFPDQIHGLVRYVDASRLLYGSDFPYTPAAGVEMLAQMMDKEGPVVFGEEKWEDVMYKNAQRLLARQK